MKHKIKRFRELRDLLCWEALLQYPDFTKPFVVITDVSGYSIRDILNQGKKEIIGKNFPIAYTFPLLNKSEQNYSTIEKELLAIVNNV